MSIMNFMGITDLIKRGQRLVIKVCWWSHHSTDLVVTTVCVPASLAELVGDGFGHIGVLYRL